MIAEMATLPVKPWIPPAYTKLIFLSASAFPSSFAAVRNSPSFPTSVSPKMQIDLNLHFGVTPFFSFFFSDILYLQMKEECIFIILKQRQQDHANHAFFKEV